MKYAWIEFYHQSRQMLDRIANDAICGMDVGVTWNVSGSFMNEGRKQYSMLDWVWIMRDTFVEQFRENQRWPQNKVEKVKKSKN